MRSKTVQVGVHSEPQQWAEEQFAGAKLTDVRRVARVKKIAETMAVHPGRSIPKLCDSPYAVKATYNLFKHEEATPDNIQAGHRAVVLQEMRQPGVYLLYLLSAPLTIPLVCCYINHFRRAASCSEAMARRRKEERRAGLASRGMVRRLRHFSSRVRHRGVPDRHRVPK